MFEQIVGNQQVKHYLNCMAKSKTFGNSLLFAGPDGIGKSLFAMEFAKMIICADDPLGNHRSKLEAGNHPDIRIYRPEGKIAMHSIASLRQFNEEVYLTPYEAKWKIFIIHDADRMLPSSANALLKTFEEPWRESIIILLSNNPTALLPTILSRCRSVYFQALSDDEVAHLLEKKNGLDSDEAKRIALLSQGSVSQALKFLQPNISQARTTLLNALAHGKLNTYRELSGLAENIAASVEQSKKKAEEDVRGSLWKGEKGDLTAAQKQSLEKEVEGVIALQGAVEGHTLFTIILGWYRDLHLWRVGGSQAYLYHPDYADATQQALQRGEIPPLENVQKAIAQARTSLERSTSLNLCLESLFLQLNLF